MSDGFKSGASADDPLGGSSDEEKEDEETKKEEEDETVEESREVTTRVSQSTGDNTSTEGSSESSSEPNGQLPWIYRRDEITDGRSKTVQLHLQETTVSTQRAARLELGNTLGDTPRKADLREAALLVGLAHLDETADQLREWGYGVE